MSEAKPHVFRGCCLVCGSKYVVVAYGEHIPSGLEVAREIAEQCPKRSGQSLPLTLNAANEAAKESDDGIPF